MKSHKNMIIYTYRLIVKVVLIDGTKYRLYDSS